MKFDFERARYQTVMKPTPRALSRESTEKGEENPLSRCVRAFAKCAARPFLTCVCYKNCYRCIGSINFLFYLIHLSLSLFFISVHCQKNKKDEDKKDEEFRCPEGQGNGNFADPATCRRFYQVIKIHVTLIFSINQILFIYLFMLLSAAS